MFSPRVKCHQIKSKCADYNTLLRAMTNVSTMANRSEFSKILIHSLPLTVRPLKIGPNAPNGSRIVSQVDGTPQGAQALQNSPENQGATEIEK